MPRSRHDLDIEAMGGGNNFVHDTDVTTRDELEEHKYKAFGFSFASRF